MEIKVIHEKDFADEYFYTVKRGDTISSVCNYFNISEVALTAANKLDSEIAEGRILIIKKTNGIIYTVMPADNIETIAAKFKTTPEEIYKKNNITYIYPFLKINV